MNFNDYIHKWNFSAKKLYNFEKLLWNDKWEQFLKTQTFLGNPKCYKISLECHSRFVFFLLTIDIIPFTSRVLIKQFKILIFLIFGT